MFNISKRHFLANSRIIDSFRLSVLNCQIRVREVRFNPTEQVSTYLYVSLCFLETRYFTLISLFRAETNDNYQLTMP